MPETDQTGTPTSTESPSPTTTESPTSLNTESLPSGEPGDDFDISIFDAPDGQTPSKAEQAIQPPAPAPQGGETGPAPQPEPQQPQPQPQPEPVAQPTGTEVPQGVDPVKAYTDWRVGAEDLLASQHFTLDPQLVKDITEGDDPNAAIQKIVQQVPRLMARVYLDAVTAATNVIATSLPGAINNTMESTRSAQANQDRFFDAWPGLKPHMTRVVEIAQVYRQVHPQADTDRFIKEVGAQAAIALGLPFEQVMKPQGQAQPSGNGLARPPLHVPPGAMPRPVAPTAPTNIFTQMAEEGDFD